MLCCARQVRRRRRIRHVNETELRRCPDLAPSRSTAGPRSASLRSPPHQTAPSQVASPPPAARSRPRPRAPAPGIPRAGPPAPRQRHDPPKPPAHTPAHLAPSLLHASCPTHGRSFCPPSAPTKLSSPETHRQVNGTELRAPPGSPENTDALSVPSTLLRYHGPAPLCCVSYVALRRCATSRFSPVAKNQTARTSLGLSPSARNIPPAGGGQPERPGHRPRGPQSSSATMPSKRRPAM